MENNWESLIQEVAKILTTKEKYQRVLGQMAHVIAKEYGIQSLDDFAEDIKEVHGISVSGSTLKNYEYVYRQTKNLELPDDLSYRTLQYIATADNPTYWAKRIKDEGLSSPEVYRLIRQEKGLDKKVRIIVCPNCKESIKLNG